MVALHERLLAERVHVDQELLLGHHLLVVDVDAVVDELLEVLANDDPQAVDDVLPRPLLDLLLRREEFVHLVVFSGELEDVLDRQGLVVWHR